MPRFKDKRHAERRSKDNVRYLSVLDTGTFAVRALVIQVQEQQVTIVGRGRAVQTGNNDLSAALSACESALRDAEDATEKVTGSKVVPDEVLLAVPTAWTCGAAGTGSVERTALEAPIMQEECYEPLVRAGRRALRNLGRITGPGQWDLLDARLGTFSINDNPVTDPVGFRGHTLQATVFVVAALRESLTRLRQIADALQLEPPQLVAEPLALAALAPDDGLIIQVGAGATNLILARHHAPLITASIPQGGLAWTRTLVGAFRLSPARIEAIKRAYGTGKLSASGQAAVQKALRPDVEAWSATIGERLQSWVEETWARPGRADWPSHIYLCGGACALPDVRETIVRARWLNSLPFLHLPDVQLFDGSAASQVNDLTEPRWQLDGLTTLALATWAARDRGKTIDGMLRTALEIT